MSVEKRSGLPRSRFPSALAPQHAFHRCERGLCFAHRESSARPNERVSVRPAQHVLNADHLETGQQIRRPEDGQHGFARTGPLYRLFERRHFIRRRGRSRSYL